MIKIKNLLMIIAVVGIVGFSGCKPTEKNYKAAYDAALAKRQAEQNDPDMNLPVGGYQMMDSPQVKRIGDKEYYYQFVRLKPLVDSVKMSVYNVAVAVYKMPTNCEAQVSDLRDAGYNSFGAKSADDRYYVLVGSYATMEDAAAEIDKYVKNNKNGVYVGLPENPVIVQSKR